MPTSPPFETVRHKAESPGSPPYDPRIVANLLLDIADDYEVAISNLALQKLLYFCHAHFLIEQEIPLIQGGFEAWKYGPVQPAVYAAFRSEADQPIRKRATATNVMTGREQPLPRLSDLTARRHLLKVVAAYGPMTPGRLVELSHASNGPWDYTIKKAKLSTALGRRITDDVIRENFRYHKVSVGPQSRVGEPREDTPITGY